MASKNFGKVNVSITASTGGLTAGLSRAGKSLGGFASTVGSALNPLRMLGRVAGSTFGQLSMFSMAQSAVNTFTSMTSAAAESIDVQSKLSRRLGTTYGELAGLKLAGDLAGVGIEQIGTAMTKSDVAMQKAVGGSKQAQQAFANLGLDAGQLQGMSSADRFKAIASAIANIQSPAERAAAAVALFGRSGATLLPLFEGGAEALALTTKEAERFGLTLTNAQAQNVENMNDSFTRVYASIQGIVQQIVSHLAPAVTGIAKTFTDYVGRIGGADIGQQIGAALLDAAEYLAGVGDYLIANFAPSIQKVFAYLSQVGGQWNSVFQLGSRVASFFAGIGRLLQTAFGLIILGITGPVEGLLYAAKKIGDALGFDTSGIDSAVQGMNAFNKQVSKDIDKNFAKAGENFSAAFADTVGPSAGEAIATPLTDAVQRFRDAAQSAASSVDKAQTQAGSQSSVVAQVRINSADLKAIVVGSSEGESFRNSIMRGADPRLDVKEDAKRTADNTERAADTLDELAGNLTGFGLATLTA
jgi:hypothetical protein